MPKVESFRIVNVDYDNRDKKINDLYIELEGKNTNIILANGCGKTFIITLLFQTINPGHVEVEGRTFESTFKDIQGTAHVAICHIIDNDQKIVTGFTVRKNEKIEYYSYILELPLYYTLKDINFVNEESIVTDFMKFREYLEKNKDVFKTQLFSEYSKSDYRRTLESYRIFKSEWDMMLKTNRIEGGISELLGAGERKHASDLLSKFILPNITYAIKKDKNKNELAETFKEQIDNIKKLPYWEKQIENGKKVIELFEKQVRALKTLFQVQEKIKENLYIMLLLHDQQQNLLNDKKVCIKTLEQEKNKLEQLLESIKSKKVEIENAYNLYKYKNLQKGIKGTSNKILQKQDIIEECEEKIELKRVLEYYNCYLQIKSKIKAIENEIDRITNDKEKLIEMKVSSSKIYDYYTEKIEQMKTIILEKNNLLNNLEDELKKHIIFSYNISNSIRNNEKDIEFLVNKRNTVLNLGKREDLQKLSQNLEKIKNCIQNKNDEINEYMKKLNNNNFNIEQYKLYIQDKEKEVQRQEEEFAKFKEDFENIKQLKRYFSIQKIENLELFLMKTQERKSISLNEVEKEKLNLEFILDYTNKNGFIPPPSVIERLETHLKENGFYDFTKGYELIKNNKSKNPLLFNSLVIEEKDIYQMNKSLKNFETNEDIILLINRNEVDTFNNNANIGKSSIKFVMNLYHKIIIGQKSLEDFKSEISEKISELKSNKEKLEHEQSEMKNYLNTVTRFKNIYGYEAEIVNKRFENILKTLTEEIFELKEKREKIIEENKIIDNKIKVLSEDILKLHDEQEALTLKKQKIDEINTLLKDRFNIQYYEIDEVMEIKRLELKTLSNKFFETKEKEKTYEFQNKKTKEELDELKTRLNEYEIERMPYEKAEFKYSNENIEELKEKFIILQKGLDIEELKAQKDELMKSTLKLEKTISQSAYTFLELEKLKDTELYETSYYNKIIKTERENMNKLIEQKGKLKQKFEDIKAKIIDFNVESIDETQFNSLSSELKISFEETSKSLEEKELKFKVLQEETIYLNKELEVQTNILSNYEEIEKKTINNLEIFQDGDLHKKFLKIFNDVQTLEKSFQMQKEDIDNGWQLLKNLVSQEGFDLAVNMGFLFDKKDFTYDYNSSETLFQRIKVIIENQIKTLTEYKNNAIKFKEKLIKSIISEVNIYFSYLKKLFKISKIKINQKDVKTLDIVLNDLTEPIMYERISAYIDKIINDIEDMTNENANEYIDKYFAIKNLLREVNGGPIKIKVYKPSNTERIKLFEWETVDSWSGGEKFFAFFCVYISLVLLIRSDLSNSMVIISDNPFGRASSEHILQPLLSMMNDNNVQFVTFTAHNDENLSKYFNYNYSLVLTKSLNTNLLKISGVESPLTFEKGYYAEW